MPFTVYHKNALRLAELGVLNDRTKLRSVGDGTVYANATGATPNPGQKTFALAGLSLIANIGADADDKFNGHVLCFEASGNIYHVVDWVAGTDTATTYETPSATDTGACQIRRSLVEGISAAGDPVWKAADGQLFALWKGSAANQIQRINVHLPNLLQQGGFEELAAGAFPGAFSVKGKWWATSADWAISATSPLLGSRMAVWTPSGSDSILLQAVSSSLKAGRKYRMILKAQAVAGATDAGAIQIYIDNRSSGVSLLPGFTGGQPWSLGAIGTSSAWFTSPDFTVGSDSNEARIYMAGRPLNKGAATAVRIDEVYFWEIVNVGALAVFRHNWEGMAAAAVSGYNCATDRTGLTVAVDYFTLSNPQAAGADAYLQTFTPAIHPIYQIQLPAFSLYPYEAGEILLAQKWEWKFPPELPDDAEAEEYDESRSKSRSGVVDRIMHSKQRVPGMELRLIDPVDVAVWKGDFKAHHLDPCHPFAAKWDGNWGDRVILFRSAEPGFSLPRRTPNYPDKKLEWEEVL